MKGAKRKKIVLERETVETQRPHGEPELGGTDEEFGSMALEWPDEPSVFPGRKAVPQTPRKKKETVHVQWISQSPSKTDGGRHLHGADRPASKTTDDSATKIVEDEILSPMVEDDVQHVTWEELGFVPDEPRAPRPRGRGTGHGKKSHEHTSEYLSQRDRIIRHIFALEWDPDVDTECDCELLENADPVTHKRLWRCVDCFAGKSCCQVCMRDTHQCSPFHTVQKWNGLYFERSSLADAGLDLYLGHGGRPCPKATKEGSFTMQIGDTTGLHDFRVFKCNCRHALATGSRVLQLLALRLFPATMSNPQTAYTFRLMEHWHMDVLQSKKPVYDYYVALVRRTRPDRQHDMCGYQNFLRAGRWWRDLMSQCESGQGHGIDEFLPTRYPKSTAIVCAACPEPGVNMSQTWRIEVNIPEKRMKHMKFLAIDGCFKAQTKLKPMDLQDPPLNEGGAYFVPYTLFLEYEKEIVALAPPDPSGTCEAIDKMHAGIDGRNTLFSGVAAVVCHHEYLQARGMVNLRKGEKFALLDLAYMGSLGPLPDVELPMGLSSDRGCQYWLKIVERWERQFPEKRRHIAALRMVIVTIGKLHIRGHKPECQKLYHPAYKTGFGRTCGENSERPWQETNHASAISRDANPGHREDIQNDTHGDWNKKKELGLAKTLLKKAKETAQHIPRTRAEYDEYSASLDDSLKASWWQKFPTEDPIVDENGVVQVRYHVDTTKLPSRKKLLELVEREEKRFGGRYAKGKGPKALMKRMIELENRQESLKSLITSDEGDSQPQDRSYSIKTARSALRQELSRVRKLQIQHMPGLETVFLVEQLAEEDGTDNPENDCPEEEDLRFPSSFTALQRAEFGWDDMAEIEMELRKCFAEIALEKFQNSVRIFHLGIEGKAQVFNTQKPGTRKQKIIKTDSERRYNWQTKYMRHYAAMVSLGHDPEKDKTYQPIERDSVDKGKDATRPEVLGSGKKGDAWWWRDSRDMGKMTKKEKEELLKLNEEEKRVRYFRYWAQWKRYDEEWHILGAEFDRAVRSHEYMQNVWTKLAERETLLASTANAKETPQSDGSSDAAVCRGRAAVAHRRSAYYLRLKEEMITARELAGTFDKAEPGRGWDGWHEHKKQFQAGAQSREPIQKKQRLTTDS